MTTLQYVVVAHRRHRQCVGARVIVIPYRRRHLISLLPKKGRNGLTRKEGAKPRKTHCHAGCADVCHGVQTNGNLSAASITSGVSN